MGVTVRAMRPDEARAFLEVRRSAVRDLASGHYPAEAIEAWAPLPVADSDWARLGEAPSDAKDPDCVEAGA